MKTGSKNKMKSKKLQHEGISLIVLVITIILMIILAGSIILTLSNNGIIAFSQEAVFKQNVKGYISELSLYVSDEIIKNPTGGTGTINSTDETIGLMLASMPEEDKAKFSVIHGDLMYKGEDKKEELWCNEIGIPVITSYDETQKLNSPKLDDGMIPVKYDEESGKWVKADKTNTNYDWYKYDDVQRKWANVVTVKASGTKTREYYTSSPAGTPIEMSDITTMFVWIPRYAYSINEGYYKVADNLSEEDEKSNQKLDITFLVGNSNIAEQTNETYIKYPTDYDASEVSVGEKTPKIVHPAFTFGDDDLTGIWVAKFEASGSTNTPSDFSTYPGNAAETSNTTPTITETTYVTVLPSVPSWRNIMLEDSEAQSMKMAKDANNAYGFNNVDTHMIKNSEWGAVAYLSVSEYGKVPMKNGKGSNNATVGYYNLLTGYQGSANEYNTADGVKASTTHNVYGVYDMNGGANERVASYLNNGSSNLRGQYFKNNKLKEEYTKYWDKYEVSEEEKTNKIQVADLGDGITEVTQGQLWKVTKTVNGSVVDTAAWNEARYRITKATYNLMANNKGDAMYEVAANNSYYGVWYNTNTNVWAWNSMMEKDSANTGVGRCWNGSYIMIGHAALCYVYRGGHYLLHNPGLFYTDIVDTRAVSYVGFRPVCIVI